MISDKKISEIANHMLRELNKTIDWETHTFNTSGDDHYAIQRNIESQVVNEMYNQIKR